MKKNEFIEYYKQVSYPMLVLMKLAPVNKLDWKPAENFWTLGQLLDHCAITSGVLTRVLDNRWPTPEERKKRKEITGGSLVGEKAAEEFNTHLSKTLEELEKLSNKDYDEKTASTPWGSKGTVSQILQGVTDHQNIHRAELYMYLKLLGLPVNTMTLYAGKVDKK